MAAESPATPAATAGSGTPAPGTVTDPTVTAPPPATPPATGAPAVPATGTPPPADAAPTYTPEQIAELVASNERIQKALAESNKENEKRRKDAKAIEDAKLTDEERAKGERAEFEAQREAFLVEQAELRVNQQVLGLAGRLGLVDVDIVTRLIDWDDLEFDDTGAPTNVEAVVKAIIARKPILAGKPGPTPGSPTGNNAGSGTGGGQPAPALTAQELAAATQAGISPERFAALKGVKTLEDWKATRRTGQ